MRGRRPEPAAIKRAERNPGRRPLCATADAAGLPGESSGARCGSTPPSTSGPEAAKTASGIARSCMMNSCAAISSSRRRVLPYELFPLSCRLDHLHLDREGPLEDHQLRLSRGAIRPYPAFRFRKDIEHNLK
jgi:hypothetical protein